MGSKEDTSSVARLQKGERILLAQHEQQAREQACSALTHFFPSAEVEAVHDWQQLEQKIVGGDFDVVVLDLDLTADRSLIELLYRLKTEDNEPSVVIVAEDAGVDAVSELYKHGCQRYIVKDDRWIDELGSAVNYIVKWRKAKAENLLLRAKLTEANMMLQEKNKRLDEFSATVAHDIRGPLASVSMRLDYILEEYADQVAPRLRELLTRAHQSTERLTSLVQSMYEYAKLGAQARNMQDVPLGELIEQTLADMPFEESLDIHVTLDDLPVVRGNPGLLRAVFINLINNAVKYNDKDRIALHFRFNGVVQRVLAPYVSLSVIDNGAGMEPEELEHVFSMFVRGQKAGDFSSGTGVGLAVVQRVIELHFGEISVESEPGKGTIFTILLPMEDVSLAHS